MGLCASSQSPEDSAEKGADKRVEQTMKTSQMADQKINKLLLLGQGTRGRRTRRGSDRAAHRATHMREQWTLQPQNGTLTCTCACSVCSGAGASGKSTLFKQMINIYGKGFSEA